MENTSLAIAFGAGFLSFLSPCVLPLVPVYLATLYGSDIFSAPVKRSRLPLFLHSLSFVLGFSIIFIMLGMGAGLAGFALDLNLSLARKISGSLLLGLGVFMLLALKVPQLNYEKRLAGSGKTAASYSRSFLTGVIFSLAWTPCVGPALGGILALAWSSETARQGGYLLAVYSLGFGFPFLVIGAAFDSLYPALKRLNRYSPVFYIASGAFLLAIGVLILTNRLGWLQGL